MKRWGSLGPVPPDFLLLFLNFTGQSLMPVIVFLSYLSPISVCFSYNRNFRTFSVKLSCVQVHAVHFSSVPFVFCFHTSRQQQQTFQGT